MAILSIEPRLAVQRGVAMLETDSRTVLSNAQCRLESQGLDSRFCVPSFKLTEVMIC